MEGEKKKGEGEETPSLCSRGGGQSDLVPPSFPFVYTTDDAALRRLMCCFHEFVFFLGYESHEVMNEILRPNFFARPVARKRRARSHYLERRDLGTDFDVTFLAFFFSNLFHGLFDSPYINALEGIRSHMEMDPNFVLFSARIEGRRDPRQVVIQRVGASRCSRVDRDEEGRKQGSWRYKEIVIDIGIKRKGSDGIERT